MVAIEATERSVAPAASNVDAVLLDLDDTLFDHSLTCRAGIDLVRQEEAFLQRRSLDELWTDYVALLDGSSGQPATSLASRDERWRRLALSCGTELSTDAARELSGRYRRYYLEQRRPIPGAVELVRRLHRRTKVAIVTNNEVAEQEEKLRFLGVDNAVDALVISEAVGASKPSPAIFRAALERLGVPAGAAVMIGDSWTNDVMGARGVGVRAVWFNRFGAVRPASPTVPELRSYSPVEHAERLLLDPEYAATSVGPPARGRS